MSSQSSDSSDSNPTPATPIMSPSDKSDDYDTPPSFGDNMVPPSAPEVSKKSESSALLRWTVPENDGLAIKFFKIQYRDISGNSKEARQWRTVEDTFSSEVREAEVRRLQIGSVYKFRVLAVFTNDDNAWGKNSRRFELEPEPHDRPAAPSTEPIIVELRSLGRDNLALRWQYQSQDISPIDGFIVYYRPYHSKGEFQKHTLRGADRRHFNLDNLDPNTHYSVEIASYNSAGPGPRSVDVVEKTLASGNVSKPLNPNELTWPPRMPTTTRAPYTYIPHNRHDANNGMLYVVLGVVLGVMLLVLFIFMLICWRKQRKQRRRMENEDDSAKFGDPSKTIYADSIRKQHVNGGTNFLLSDLGTGNKPNYNGGGPPMRNGSLGNGHVTTSMGFMQPMNGGEQFTMTSNPMNEYDEANPGMSGEQDLEHLRASIQQAFHPPSSAPPPPERGVTSYTAAEYARHPHNPYFEVDPNSDTIPRVNMGPYGCRDCSYGSRPHSRAEDPYTSGNNQYGGMPNNHIHQHLHSNAPPEYNSLNLRHMHRLSGSDYPDYSGSLRKPKTNPHMGYDSGYRASPDHIPRSHERPYRTGPMYDPYSRNGQYTGSPGGPKLYDPYNGSSQDTAYGSAHDQSGNMSDVYEQLGSEKSYSSSSQVSGRPKVRRKSKKPYVPVAAVHSEHDLPDNPPQLSSPAEAPPQLPPRNTPPSLSAMPSGAAPPVNPIQHTPPIREKPIPASRNKLLPRQASNSSSSDNNTGNKSQPFVQNGDTKINHELLDAPSSGAEQCGTENGGSMSPQVSLSTDPRNLESDLDIDQINVSDNEGGVFTGAEMTDSHVSSSVVDDYQDDVDDNDLLDNEMVSSSHPLFSTPAGSKHPPQLSAHARYGGSPVASPIAVSTRMADGSSTNPESQPLMGSSAKHRNIPRVNDYPSDDENDDS